MESLMDMVLTPQVVVPIGVLLLLFIAIPIAITSQSVAKMRRGVQLTPLPPEAWTQQYDRMQVQADWALQKGFDTLIGMYVFKLGAAAILSVWRHRKHPTYFSVIFTGGKPILHFLTEFSENLDLTTGNVNHFHLLPQPPGHYVQTFRKLSLDDLFERHMAAARYLTTKGGVKVRPVSRSFEETFTSGEAVQGAYVQSLSLWLLRVPYWCFLRKALYHNKTIEDLHRAGKLSVPNDRGFIEFTFT